MASSSKDNTDSKSEVSSDILKNLISELETLENQSIHPVEDDPETKIDKLTGTSAMLKVKEFVDSDDRGFEAKLKLLEGCKNFLEHKIQNERKSLENVLNNQVSGSRSHDDSGKNKKEGDSESNESPKT